jgi:hypothetical protein
MTATAIETSQHDTRSRTRALAWFALAGIIAYVAIDVALKFLRPGYSLIYNAESDYGRGPWFWVMDINFLLRCALSLAVIAALAAVLPSSGRTRTGVVLLAIWAVCSGLLAFFADNIEGTAVTASGAIHLLLAFIAFVAVAIGTIVLSTSFSPDQGWGSARTVLLTISIAGAAAFLLLGHAVGHSHAPGGLYERIFLGLELLWMVTVACYVLRSRSAD